MNRGKAFRNRLNMRLHGMADTAEQIEETVKDQANALAEQTREGLMRGQKAVSAWEKNMESSMRSHPMIYLGAALAVIGLLLAKIIFDRSHG